MTPALETKKHSKAIEAETRKKMRQEFANSIANMILEGLREKITAGSSVSNRDIAEVLRPIVDEIDFDDKVFKKILFADTDDLLDEVTPLIYRGINLGQEEKPS